MWSSIQGLLALSCLSARVARLRRRWARLLGMHRLVSPEGSGRPGHHSDRSAQCSFTCCRLCLCPARCQPAPAHGASARRPALASRSCILAVVPGGRPSLLPAEQSRSCAATPM
ncbi:hypothetical protein DMC30DRAFT_385867 [Rhodotorula diobovata]|uniref:Secreted protein n=1 Tax=Rhodotorula diobovata TaxID=5288 RepID=A0A5C5G686_9BASI|nr:hypothetical protein DMC30DRAFT_385867 [Rhodotorula diobovata]